MTSIDPIINQMRESGCNTCECGIAIYDETKEQVRITGSFCTPIPGALMIEISAYNLETRDEVWTDTCDTGKLCAIPFELVEEWICYTSSVDYHDIVFVEDQWEIHSVLGLRGKRAVFNSNQYKLLLEICDRIEKGETKYKVEKKEDFDAILQFNFVPGFLDVSGFLIEYNNDSFPFEEHRAIFVNPEKAKMLLYVMNQTKISSGVVMELLIET